MVTFDQDERYSCHILSQISYPTNLQLKILLSRPQRVPCYLIAMALSRNLWRLRTLFFRHTLRRTFLQFKLATLLLRRSFPQLHSFVLPGPLR